VNAIKQIHTEATTMVKMKNGVSKEFEVMCQGSVLSHLLFIIVMEVLLNSFKLGVTWERLYADDLVLMGVSEEKL